MLQAGREARVLGRNPIGERSMAIPAVSRVEIHIRTDDHLIRVATGR